MVALVGPARRLAASETLRCQGVDDAEYIWRVTDTEKYRLAGNAMSLPVVKAVLLELLRGINTEVGQAADGPEPGVSGATELGGNTTAFARTLRATRRGVRARCLPSRSQASRAGSVFLDVFSTGGGIASQVEGLGFKAIRWGGRFGPRYDVCNDGRRREVVRLVNKGHVFGALLTPPGGAGRYDDQSLKATAAIIDALIDARIPWIFAAPTAADACSDHDIQRLALTPRVQSVVGDLCSFGSGLRGRTRFLASRLEGCLDGLAVQCRGTGGLCWKTSRQHVRTRAGATRPARLRVRLANILVDEERATYSNSFDIGAFSPW